MRVPEPALVEGRVDAARGDELIVPPALDDPASIEDEHDVGALRGREPVRDGYGRPPRRRPPPAAPPPMAPASVRSVSGSPALVASSRIRSPGSASSARASATS